MVEEEGEGEEGGLEEEQEVTVRGKKRTRGVGNARALNSRKKKRRREILAFMGTWWYRSIEEL